MAPLGRPAHVGERLAVGRPARVKLARLGRRKLPRLAVGQSSTYSFVSAEKARCLPSGEGTGSWINRAFTGPSSTRTGKLSREPTGCETRAGKGIT